MLYQVQQSIITVSSCLWNGTCATLSAFPRVITFQAVPTNYSQLYRDKENAYE